MRFIIPPESTFPANDFQIIADWFVECGIVLADVDGTYPIWIDTDDSVMCVTSYGIAKAPAKPGPHRSVATRVLTTAGMRTMDPIPDAMELAEQLSRLWNPQDLNPPAEPVDEATALATVAIDDLKQWVDQLAEARQTERDAKDRAQEARDQILAYLRDNHADIGSVDGRPAVEWKLVAKKQFETTRFRTEHPELADEFTTERTENRLELL